MPINIVLVEYFPGHGYEAWITDLIELNAGMGDVFDTRDEALEYAAGHNVPIVDLSYIERSYLEGDHLRSYMRQHLKLSHEGYIEAIL